MKEALWKAIEAYRQSTSIEEQWHSRDNLGALINAALSLAEFPEQAQPVQQGWTDDQMNRFAWMCVNPGLGNDSIRERLSLFREHEAVRCMAAPVQAGAQVKTETCPVCGEDAPFTGSCGGGRDNPKALCYEAAPVQQEQPCGNEAHFTTRQERKPLGQDWIEERAHRRCRRYIMIDTEAPYQFNANTLMDLVRDIEAKIKEQA